MAANLGGVHVADTTPYPWPYDGDLAGAGTAVLVIQPACPWPGAVDQSVLVAAAEVTAAVEAAGGAVITLHTAPPPSHAEGGPDSGLPAGKHHFTSEGIDGFYGNGLEAHLRRESISRLILVGLAAETSIHSTMRTANDMGYECLFVRDACQGYAPELAGNTVSIIEMSGGIFGAVGTADAVVAAMTGRKDS
jgi:nicotinamidase-related amidase